MAARRRILFLSDINSIHTENWVRNLTSEGCEIGIFSLSQKNTDWVDELQIKYYSVGFSDETIRSKNNKGKWRYFSYLKELKAFFDEFQPEIVHAHYASSYGMLATRLAYKNTILSLWGSDVYEFPKRGVLQKWILKRALKKSKLVCSTSLDMAKEAKKYVNREYIVTPFPVDTDRFTIKEKSKSNVLVIGTIKTLEPVYGVDRLIKLFSEFKKKSSSKVRLSIYGKGSQENELKTLVNKLNLEEYVTFHGFVTGNELVRAYQSLDIFVALSRRESFGVSVLEAQSCGIPVITSNVGGLPEVQSESSGIIIEGDDLSAGIKALENLLDDKTRNKMGLEGRKFVEQNFSVKACVNKMLEVYARI